MNFYNFHIGDYIKHTAHLSNDEDIAYRRLLDMYYDTEQPIPIDNPLVSRRLRVGIDVLDIVLKEFFLLTENGYINKRADAEIAEYHAYLCKQRDNGKRGGRPKNRANAEEKTHGLAVGNPIITQNNPNQKPETRNQYKNKTELICKFDAETCDLPSTINQVSWREWAGYRKTVRRKAVSQQAAKKNWSMLSKYDFETQAEIIKKSISNDYSGLFEPVGKQDVKKNETSFIEKHTDRSWRESIQTK